MHNGICAFFIRQAKAFILLTLRPEILTYTDYDENTHLW